MFSTKLTDPPSKVLENLFIGSEESATSRTLLQELKVKHVLTASEKGKFYWPNDFNYERIMINDTEDDDLGKHTQTAVEFIEKGMTTGGVLVHCKAGMSRSAALVILFLMCSKRMSLLESYLQCKVSRNIISPNPGFVKQLAAVEAKLFDGVISIDPAEYEEERFGVFHDIPALVERVKHLKQKGGGGSTDVK